MVVEVAVFDDDRVVTGLTAADFEVRDNGVRQKVSDVDFNTLPLDLRLVFDVSGSITPDQLEWYARAMHRVAARLESRDRCEIIAFNARIADLASRQHPPVTIDLSRRGGREGTAFFDAVTATSKNGSSRSAKAATTRRVSSEARSIISSEYPYST